MARRLAAILAYDVVGYSSAVGRDEAGTLRTLKSHRLEVIDPEAELNGGRTIKLTGDGALMEFASVVDAVLFAVRTQIALAQRNAELPEDSRLTYRMGVNLGDVVIDGDDIYGDGVNVAARLEGLAPPGGICVRRRVRAELRGKLDLDFDDLGDVEVKNIEEPISAFSVILNEKAQALAAAPVERRQRDGRRRPYVPFAAAALVALVLAVIGVLQPWRDFDDRTESQQTVAPVSDGASIAVLPFTNISDDADQEYFADGITEDLITDLSKVPDLLVIARNSVFTYKGKAVKVPEVAAELGVKYVMEGSVRRVGDRVRINAQLINAADGTHIWAERYDRAL
ncbi:MAG: adenylate/guanylate cyclase domain-containing protein, partial [Acidiferrobacterales bacterium]|nr:adenylate/guanylate cyclase domain-containing protein [Acidiferrobacterales bacterium]